MLLRTLVLLLCVSTGMCAALGHYQAPAKEEEEALAVDSVTDGVVEAASVDAVEEVVAPEDPKVDDPPADEEPEANSIVGDDLVAEILEVDNPEAEQPEADQPEADQPEADQPEAEQPEAEQPEADQPEAEQPEADQPEEDIPVADGATAEEPDSDSDSPAGDAVEELTGEAVTQEQPSSSEAEEENDIQPVQTSESQNEPEAHEDDNSWGLTSIRNSFQIMHGYFDSLVEMSGGRDGVCQYRCRYGELPKPRPGYQLPEPNGCSSSLVGFQLDLGIPAMTMCCDQLDMCYDTCGTSKYDCDSKFRLCMHGICSDLKKSLGFVSKVQACESMVDALHSTVGTLGCMPYMNSQRAACVCEGEQRDEL